MTAEPNSSVPAIPTARVLYAAADATARASAEAALAEARFAVEPAHDSASALARVGDRLLDAAILDLGPEGVETLKAIRAAAPDLPVMIALAREDVSALEAALRFGASSYATAPLDWRAVPAQLRYLLSAAEAETLFRTSPMRRASDTAAGADSLRRLAADATEWLRRAMTEPERARRRA